MCSSIIFEILGVSEIVHSGERVLSGHVGEPVLDLHLNEVFVNLYPYAGNCL